jgi:nucleoside-triphosphatase THEP1
MIPLVKRVLITGMSGTGKSTVIRELRGLGHKTVDTDWDRSGSIRPLRRGMERDGFGVRTASENSSRPKTLRPSS